MRKNNSLILIFGIACSLAFAGCSSSEAKPSEKESIELKPDTKQDNEPQYIYNGNYKVKYSNERVVWFSPYITKEGDVVSERTGTILPSFPTWTKKEATPQTTNISKDIIDFLEEKK
jgi:hypothetical protein